MNKLFLLLFLLSFYACTCNQKTEVKNDGVISLDENLVEGMDINTVLANKSELLPNMCELVPKSYIAEVLGLEEGDLTPRNSSPAGSNPNHKTCFFKWNDPNFPNSGIMMQAMKNPMTDEFPEYITTFIESKRTNGENTMTDEVTFYYKDFKGLGNDGVYNSDLGKYYWRFSDQVIFFLAFNSIHEHQEQMAMATKLAKRMTKEYLGLE